MERTVVSTAPREGSVRVTLLSRKGLSSNSYTCPAVISVTTLSGNSVTLTCPSLVAKRQRDGMPDSIAFIRA